MTYKPATDATQRDSQIKGTDGRQWVLVDWQVVYDYTEPDERMSYENYVPADEDADEYLTRTYGPWQLGSYKGKALSQRR